MDREVAKKKETKRKRFFCIEIKLTDSGSIRLSAHAHISTQCGQSETKPSPNCYANTIISNTSNHTYPESEQQSDFDPNEFFLVHRPTPGAEKNRQRKQWMDSDIAYFEWYSTMPNKEINRLFRACRLKMVATGNVECLWLREMRSRDAQGLKNERNIVSFSAALVTSLRTHPSW